MNTKEECFGGEKGMYEFASEDHASFRQLEDRQALFSRPAIPGSGSQLCEGKSFPDQIRGSLYRRSLFHLLPAYLTYLFSCFPLTLLPDGAYPSAAAMKFSDVTTR